MYGCQIRPIQIATTGLTKIKPKTRLNFQAQTCLEIFPTAIRDTRPLAQYTNKEPLTTLFGMDVIIPSNSHISDSDARKLTIHMNFGLAHTLNSFQLTIIKKTNKSTIFQLDGLNFKSSSYSHYAHSAVNNSTSTVKLFEYNGVLSRKKGNIKKTNKQNLNDSYSCSKVPKYSINS